MRFVLIVVTALAMVYGGYWFVGSAAVEQGAGVAFERLAAGGWDLQYDDINTSGFPSRFDTTFTEPRVVAPDGTVAWAAPFLQVLALSYRPNHAIVAWPEMQSFAVPGGPGLGDALAGSEVTVLSDRLRASVTVRTRTDLALHAAILEGDDVAIEDERSGYELAAGRVVAAIRDPGPEPATYDLSLEARDVLAGVMPEAADLRILAKTELDRPLDRRLREPPRLRSLSIGQAGLTVGKGELDASGDLVVAADGTLTGEIHVTVANWEAVIAAVREAGLIDEGLAVFYRRVLDEAAAGADTAELPLTFMHGRVAALGLPFGVVAPLPPPRAAQRQ